MLECTVDAFLSTYCPFLPDNALIDAAIQALDRERLLVLNERGEPGHWQEIDEEPRYTPAEKLLFKHFANLLGNDLGELNGRQCNFFYRDCSNDEVKSETAGCNFKVDACFTGNPDHVQYNHAICSETAVVATSEESTENFEGNRERLVSAATYIMTDDPCRMWMYGITIENTEMVVWYFSRSHIVKSKTFDFTKDFRTFIRVFLSFIYATREEMGYDPTVHRIKGQGKRLQYVYEIPTENGTRYFKTIDLIAHQGAHCITGRNTRVWRAVEVNGFEGNAINEKPNGNKEVVLKDVWLDDGSKTEKQKLDAIFERLKTVKEEAYQWAPPSLRSKLNAAFESEGYKEYFMEIVCDNFNLGKSKNASDPEILHLGADSSAGDDRGNGAEAPSAHNSKEANSAEYSDMSILAQLTGYGHINACPYRTKRQYRLVYKEVGVSLDRVETLQTAFNALLDTYVALVLMYLAGWMHRDVSAGNIIAVKKPGGKSGGKLSDLEHAKHYEDDSCTSDPKMGTAFFMPLEIHMGKTYNRAHAKKQSRAFKLARDLKFDPFDPILPIGKKLLPQNKAKRSQRRQIKYRFQHDLESLWWVALYILIYRVAHPPAEELCKKVFLSTSLPSLARQQLFEQVEAVMWALEQYMHPALQNECIMASMDTIADILYDSYFLDEPVGPEALGVLYGDFFQNLAVVVITIMTEVKDIKLYSTYYAKSQKRAHHEISSKHRDGNEYEPGSDDAVRRRRKRASTSTSTSVRR